MKDDPRVQAFLKAACRGVHPLSSREEIREELLAHLDESIAAKLDIGLPQDEAITRAIEELGEPREIARGLAVAHRPVWLQWPFLALTSSMLFVIGVLGLGHLANVGFRQIQEKSQQEIATFQERFLNDQAVLSSEPFFWLPGRRKDAGIMMNRRIPWEDAGHLLKIEKTEGSGLSLSEELQEKLKAPNWFEQKLDLDAQDSSWIRDLAEYDHWDVFRSGPLKDYLDRNSDASFWTLPIPNYTFFQTWAKIRILQGIRDRNLVPAFREARHLAQLVYSQEFLVSDMVAVAMLRAEKVAYEFAVSHRLLAPSEWTPMSEEILIRARRAMYGYKQFLSFWMDPSLLVRLFDGKTARAGMCSTFTEALAGLTLDRAFLSSALPWEPDLTGKFDQLNDIIRQVSEHCRLSQHFIALWSEPERAKTWIMPASVSLNSASWESILFGYLPHIPIFRRWAWARLHRIAIPSYLAGPYKKFQLPEENE